MRLTGRIGIGSFAMTHRNREREGPPRPTSLFTQIRPPWSSTNFRHRVSPSPVPSTFADRPFPFGFSSARPSGASAPWPST